MDSKGQICINHSHGTCGRGSFATVYLCGDEDRCYKVFDDPKIDYVDREVFDYLISENLDGIYQIEDFFYKKVDDEMRPAGYIMKFLPKADMKTFRMSGVDLLDKDSDYILESYRKLSETVLKLSRNGILMNDTEEYNASLEDEGIILYDVDGFKKSTAAKEEIYMKNMKALNGLMINLISKSIFQFHSKEVNVESDSSYFESIRTTVDKVDFYIRRKSFG